jgi:cytoskeletal protein CcmA (bactofilin family)
MSFCCRFVIFTGLLLFLQTGRVCAAPPAADTDTATTTYIVDEIASNTSLGGKTSKKAAKLKDKVLWGNRVVVESDEKVKRAVAVFDSVTIRGFVEKDAVAVSGDLVVESGAVIRGDVMALGGDITIMPGAVVEGKAVAAGGHVDVLAGARLDGRVINLNMPAGSGGFFDNSVFPGFLFLAFAIVKSLFILIVVLLIAWFAPARVAAARDYLKHKTAKSFFMGLLMTVMFLPIVILFAVTIIGIPLIPLFFILSAIIMFFGLTALFAWFGQWLPFFKNRNSQVLTVAMGFFLSMLINYIPFGGTLFLMITSMAAAGATFLSRFGRVDR